MKQARILFFAALWGLLPGCIKFPVVGSYYYKEVLIGTVSHNPFSGSSYIQVEGRNHKVRCEGNTYATYAPLFTVHGAGYGGEGELKCDDGNTFKMQWAALSWSKGYGVGYNRDRDRVVFAYGMEETEAENFFQKELPHILKRAD